MFDRYLRGVLLDEAGDGTGGGGGTGDGTGTGTGTGTGDAPAFDPKTFTADLMKSVTDSINGALNGYDKKLDAKLKNIGTSATKQPDAATGKQADPFADDKAKEQDERIKALEERTHQAERKAQEKERDAEIRGMMSKFEWAKDADKDAVFEFYQMKANRNEAGELVVKKDGKEYPLSTYIEGHIPRAFKGELAPRNVGGSGADSKTRAGVKTGIDIDNINSKMSADADAQARAAILAALADSRR